jgi:hypothetical protein
MTELVIIIKIQEKLYKNNHQLMSGLKGWSINQIHIIVIPIRNKMGILRNHIIILKKKVTQLRHPT